MQTVSWDNKISSESSTVQYFQVMTVC